MKNKKKSTIINFFIIFIIIILLLLLILFKNKTETPVITQYEVIFQNIDETILQKTIVNQGEIPVYDGEEPTFEDDLYTYKFIGWDKELTEICSNVTYTATYEKEIINNESYTVTFKNIDGTVLLSKKVKYGETPKYTLEQPTYVNGADVYEFKGWDKKLSEVKSDQVYIAKYNITEYDNYITFSSDYEFELGFEYCSASGLECSVDKTTWTSFNLSGKSNTVNQVTSIKDGDKYYVYVRGKNMNSLNVPNEIKKYIFTNFTITDTDPNSLVTPNDNFSVDCTGNIMTLLDYENPNNVLMDEYAFIELFKNCSYLKSSPALPATTLNNNCYEGMFLGCSCLVKAPKLPATTLKNNCYRLMFSGCSSLINAPNLPATELADCCYACMFCDCLSLIKAPELPATTLYKKCYESMFYDCKSLVNAPKLPATELADCCYVGMFSNCTNLITAPNLPATILYKSCYSEMFLGCENLVNAPKLPAKKLENNCYEYMFAECESLVNAPELPATILFNCCYMGMFSGCLNLENAPELPATTLKNSCYKFMFEYCESLNSAPKIYATTLADNCCEEMFYSCTSIKLSVESGKNTFFTCPDTTDFIDPVSYMFGDTKDESGVDSFIEETPITGRVYYWN